MDLRGYLRAIRLNWWIVVMLGVLGALGGIVNVQRATPVYAGHVVFFVASPGTAASTSVSGDLTAAEDLAVSYARLLSSDRLATMIADVRPSIGLTAGEVSGKVSGTAELNTVLLNATVQDTSRRRLKLLTRAVATQFPLMVDRLNNPSARVTLSVTSGPTVGTAPVSPRVQLQVGLGVVIGLLLGLALAVGRYLLDTSVRSVAVIPELTGHPSLGSVPFDAQAKREPLVNAGQEHTSRAEAFRQVRTNLSFIDAANPIGVFVVTSALPGEGKSTTACNLALVFAETGRSVLLVEADLRRPRTSEYLGLERVIGLSNVLANQVDLADATQHWGDTTLSVLTSGALPPNPSELLGSEQMTDLLVRLRRRYDLVIIDTPPLLPVTDAAVLATQVDGVVLVARFGKTRRAQLQLAAQTLLSVNARVLGVVLNMSRRERATRYAYDTATVELTGSGVDATVPAPGTGIGNSAGVARRAGLPAPRWQDPDPAPVPQALDYDRIMTAHWRQRRKGSGRRRYPVDMSRASSTPD